jgi:UDPglucose--hexose-1-phosphate uridylyltransferase
MVWEERWHPLRREWVVVSAHRDHRPWSGETVGEKQPEAPSYDADCYLCPGNARVGGARNPEYTGVYTFDNDHPCVGPLAPGVEAPADPVLRNRRADGLARVVCFTPRHDVTLAQLGTQGALALLRELQSQYTELAARPEVNHVLMFENKGEVVGVSNPHPHSQIYATNFVFRTIETEVDATAEHMDSTGRVLFQDVIAAEETDGRRIVASRPGAVSFVPYFARFPYETFVAPRERFGSVAEMDEASLRDLAATLEETLVRMDNLWRMPIPYVMVLHQQPTDGREYPGFHFHVQIHPPLRRPGLLKYMAGPELGGGNFLNDTAPEEKAAELRAVPAVHYSRVDHG